MLNYMFDHLWALLVFLGMLYSADYYLTIIGARLYRKQQHILIEGGYELNPNFEKDIDALKQVSPKFLCILAGMLALYTLIWYGVHVGFDAKEHVDRIVSRIIFDLMVGMFAGLQITIIGGHAINIGLF